MMRDDELHLGEQGELRGRCDKRGDYIGSMKEEQTKANAKTETRTRTRRGEKP